MSCTGGRNANRGFGWWWSVCSSMGGRSNGVLAKEQERGQPHHVQDCTFNFQRLLFINVDPTVNSLIQSISIESCLLPKKGLRRVRIRVCGGPRGVVGCDTGRRSSRGARLPILMRRRLAEARQKSSVAGDFHIPRWAPINPT